MNKQEFLSALRQRLYGLPQEDIERSLDFYAEMIDDRVEDGMTEEQATSQIGSVDDIAKQILSETPLPKLVKKRVKHGRSLTAWELLLLILGSPIWASLLIAAVVVILAVYIVIWSVVISLYAIDVALAACGIGGVGVTMVYLYAGNVAGGIFFTGAGLICVGLSVLMLLGCNQVIGGMVSLSKSILLGIKRCIVGKGDLV